MTDLTEERDLVTEVLENNAFLFSNGLPNSTNTSAYQTPFYVDSDGKLNFAYGINITAMLKPKTATLTNQIATAITTFESYFPRATPQATLDSITNALVTFLTSSQTSSDLSTLNSSIPSQDWRPVAADVMDNFYTNSAIPDAENKLGLFTFDSLSDHAVIALEELQYNTGGTFWGDSIIHALQQSTPDYATAAYELAFDTAHDTATPSSTDIAYGQRAVTGAAQMLGFDVTFDSSHNIASLLPSSDISNATVIKFMQQVATAANDLSNYLSTAPVTALMSEVTSYLAALGFYVVQSGDTWVTIASQVNTINAANGIGVSGDLLQQMNAVLPGGVSILAAGGLVYVPTNSSACSTTPVELAALADGLTNQSFVFDKVTNTEYAVGTLPGTSAVCVAIDSVNGYCVTVPQSGGSGASPFIAGSASVSAVTNDGTHLIETSSECMIASFARCQVTPDLRYSRCTCWLVEVVS